MKRPNVFGKLLLAALATSALAMVFLPVTDLEAPPGFAQYLHRAAAFMVRIACVAAALLGLVLVWSTTVSSATTWLVLFLTTSSVVLVTVTMDRDVRVGIPFLSNIPTAIQPSAIAIAGIASALFAANFPRAVAQAELLTLLAPPPEHAHWPRMRLGLGPFNYRVVNWIHAVFQRPWATMLAGVALVAGLQLAFGLKVAKGLSLLLAINAGLLAFLVLNGRFFEGSQDTRRQTLWVFLGFAAAFWAAPAIAGTTQIAFSESLDHLWIRFVMALGALFMTVCLAIAVFWSGSLDPDLAIRRSTVYGSLGAIAIFLVGAVDTAISDFILQRLGLPSGWSVWIAGGIVAVIIAAIHRRLKATVERLMLSIRVTIDR